MTERKEGYLLRGKIQMDDSYLGRELPGGKAGQGSENKIPIVAAFSFNEATYPIHARTTAVSGFSSEAIAMPGSQGLSDGLACFRAVTTVNCYHKSVVTGGKHPNDLRSSAGSTLCWATSRSASAALFMPSTIATRACGYDKYSRRYLGGFCFHFNRRFSMAAMTEPTANVVCCCPPCTQRDLRLSETHV